MKEEIDSLLRSSMDICLKPSRLPCGKSPSVCLLKHIPHCCWCTDTRSIAEKNTVFLDKYGFVDLRDYRVNVPIDIHYCPGCKCSTESRDDLVKSSKSSIRLCLNLWKMQSKPVCVRRLVLLKRGKSIESPQRFRPKSTTSVWHCNCSNGS